MTVITAPSLGSRLKVPPPSRSVLVMTVVHNPSDSRIWYRQVDALLTSGWHVTYVAPFSGYGQCPPVPDARAERPIRLEIIGDAPEPRSAAALRQAEREGILTWRGFLPSHQALASISGALAGLCLLGNLPNFRCSLRTKVVEYGAFGIPVIATPLPLAERLVRDANSGVVVPWGDPEVVVRAVVALRDDPNRAALLGSNGHATAVEQYDWRTWSGRFVHVMELLAHRANRRQAPTRVKQNV